MNEIDLDEAMTALLAAKPGSAFITMAPRQWDRVLAEAYADGWTLIEVDKNQVPVKAFRRLAS